MNAAKALKRAEQQALKDLKKDKNRAIRTLMQEIKKMSGYGQTFCTIWVDKRYIQNVKEHFDKLGYRTEIKEYQEGACSNELWVKWGRQ